MNLYRVCDTLPEGRTIEFQLVRSIAHCGGHSPLGKFWLEIILSAHMNAMPLKICVGTKKMCMFHELDFGQIYSSKYILALQKSLSFISEQSAAED
jgi:hypothetical protein